MPQRALQQPVNRLIEALEPDQKARLRRASTLVSAEVGEVICDPGAEIDQMYFPEGAVISLQTVLESGDMVETGSIGLRGAFGLLAPAGDSASTSRAVVQVAGPLRRVPAQLVYRELFPVGRSRDVLLAYADRLMAQVQQSAACNATHSTRQRIARWLLTMQDHLIDAGKPDASLSYTHEALARILGTTRKSVTLVAQAMARSGLIRYRRGKIDIVDRPGLEAMCCECYAALREPIRRPQRGARTRPAGARRRRS